MAEVAEPAQQIPAPTTKRRRRGTEHRCGHCDRTFKRSEHLERHVRTHTKEKPFICKCGAAFTRRDLLTRHHRLSMHGDSNTTPSLPPPPPQTQSLPPPVSAPTETHQQPPQQIRRPDSDLDRAAAAESLSNLSSLGVQPPQPVQQWHPPPPNNHFGDVDQMQSMPQHVNGKMPEYHQPLDGPQMFDQGDFSGFDQFREFADFLDGIGLPSEWSPYFHQPDFMDPTLEHQQQHHQHHHQQPHENGAAGSRPGTRPGTPFSSWLPSAPQGNKISGPVSAESPRSHDTSALFKVTEEHVQHLNQSLSSFQHTLSQDFRPPFRLPSRHALTRYITSYFEGFATHMVFIHVPTFRIADVPIEVLLSIATVGAQYSFEHGVSHNLFRAGRAVVFERLRRERDRFGPKTNALLGMHIPLNSETPESVETGWSGSQGDGWEPIDAVRALINLMAYATWDPKPQLVQEALALQTLLTQILRDLGLTEPPVPPLEHTSALTQQDQWLSWVREESARRAKLIAFSFIHVHSIAYNTYPTLRTNELHLRLPSEAKEWKAMEPASWEAERRGREGEQLLYQDALGLLLRNRDNVPLHPIPSALGNYLLLHGLIQRIFIVRDLSLPLADNTASLPLDEVEKLDRGLRAWTTIWQHCPESSLALDPNNINGPIPFTSSALLALAYARIYLPLGPHRLLESRNPHAVASALHMSPPVVRSDGVITALLYATHALSIPVRLGIDRVARSQAFFWSVRHSLSGLECAVLLSKWLIAVHTTVDTSPLSPSEDRILNWVRRIVEEAYSVVDFEEQEEWAVMGAGVGVLDARELGMAVLKIWAHFFKGNTQWGFINILGSSLERYRLILCGQ